MKSAARLLEIGEYVELRGRWDGGFASRRLGEVLSADARGIRLRQTQHDFVGATDGQTVIATDGKWVPARSFLDTEEKVIVVFWRNLSAVEVLSQVGAA